MKPPTASVRSHKLQPQPIAVDYPDEKTATETATAVSKRETEKDPADKDKEVAAAKKDAPAKKKENSCKQNASCDNQKASQANTGRESGVILIPLHLFLLAST
jgi:hypothetical protein